MQKASRRTRSNWLLFVFLLPLGTCAIPQRSLLITLDETPLYSEKQWAVVNMPYVKVRSDLAASQTNYLLRFGNIVEVQRIEIKDKVIWAFILWQDDLIQSNVIKKGWVLYGFLHLVENLKEAQLASYQMLIPKESFSIFGSEFRETSSQ